MIHFELPKNQSSILKVIGVGGGGSNAVNYMYSLGIDGVDFVVCNTDSQALALSPVANKVQLGPHLTQGLGAGANPDIGKLASEESFEDINKILKINTRMAFITAGMGGGTGTGGAPVIAKICKDLNILTVGIVTTPFTYEGRKRMKQAQEGIERMREYVDTILIISNDKLRQQFGNLPFTQAFAKADDILATAAKCITDVITTTGQINVDFADVCTVMRDGGVAILGSASASGDNRALHAVELALNSPLLNDSDITGAKWILLNITSAAGEHEHTMDEAEDIQGFVQQKAGDGCDVILGMGHDPNLGDKIAVTVIATGFQHKEIVPEVKLKGNEPEKIIVKLNEPLVTDTVAAVAEPMVMVNPMAPVLVEMEEVKQPVIARQPVAATQENYVLATVSEPKPAPAPVAAPAMKNAEEIQLVIRNEEQVSDTAPVVKIGERVLTDEELEERRRFEEQKKLLEDRAERLRRMSFNIKQESSDELEAVPAYMRKNVKLDNQLSSSDNYYSGYSVGMEDKHQKKAAIQTINSFLDGKKPD
jgi:cell division protein FtsZ